MRAYSDIDAPSPDERIDLLADSHHEFENQASSWSMWEGCRKHCFPVVTLTLVVMILSLPAYVRLTNDFSSNQGGVESEDGNCYEDAICDERLELITHNIKPVLLATIQGPNTILGSINITHSQHDSNYKSNTYTVHFWAMEPGLHTIRIFEQYTSLSSSLRDYNSTIPNPVFFGENLGTFHRFIHPKVPRSLSRDEHSQSRPGYWSRAPGVESLLGLECPAFYVPAAIMEEVNRAVEGEHVTLRAASVGLYKGVKMRNISAQVSQFVLSKPSISTKIPLNTLQNKININLQTQPPPFSWIPSTPPPRAPHRDLEFYSHCLRAASPIIFLTDSVGRYLYHYLACALDLEFAPDPFSPPNETNSDSIRCNTAVSKSKGIRLQHVAAHGLTTPGFPPSVQSAVLRLELDRLNLNKGSTPTLIINPGLWDVAYGVMKRYENELGVMMREMGRLLGEGKLNRVRFLGITQVHPGLYEGLGADVEKQYMTQTRVEMIARSQSRVVLKSNSSAIRYVNLFDLSRTRGDDPLLPQDMRHYGPGVTREMVRVLLDSICQEN